MHSGEIELALARHLDTRQNLIVPNVFWGLNFHHEIDLLVVTQSGYAWEIEIKISIQDLKNDQKKTHCHRSDRIKRFYFAVPEKLKDQSLLHIPEHAGLFSVKNNLWVTLVKAPKVNTQARKFNDGEIDKLYELVSMRMWNQKEINYKLQKKLISRREDNAS